MRTPTVTLVGVPTGVVVGEEFSVTCTAAANATVSLMVVDSSDVMVPLIEVETTANSRSVNVTATSTGLHNVTCTADNGLTDATSRQFYAISEFYRR